MGLVGRLLTLRWALARVLDRHGAGDDQHFLQTAQLGRFQQHAAHARVHRQAGKLAAQRRELAVAVYRREFLQQVETVADGLAIRRFDKREIGDLAQAQVQHLQDHSSEVGAQDLRVGKFRAPDKVFFAVQAHANTRLNPAATAFTLVGAGLGNRLDGQTLHFGAVAVATDARRTAVDHVANARHGQRGFRDVGRQYHAPARVGLENALLLGR